MMHYKKHEQNNSLLTFQEKFPLENALCTSKITTFFLTSKETLYKD